GHGGPPEDGDRGDDGPHGRHGPPGPPGRPGLPKLVDLHPDVISPNTASKNLQTVIGNITQTPKKETRPDEVNEMSPQAAPNPAGNSNPAYILKSYAEIKKGKKKNVDEFEILKKKITSLETLNELLQKENADLTNISHKQKQLEKKKHSKTQKNFSMKKTRRTGKFLKMTQIPSGNSKNMSDDFGDPSMSEPDVSANSWLAHFQSLHAKHTLETEQYNILRKLTKLEEKTPNDFLDEPIS
ncbi:Hypothetical predicted protein, partial [Paramuricea clavata]